MKKLKFLLIFLSAIVQCNAEKVLVAEKAKEMLKDASYIVLDFHTGYAGEPSKHSVAMLFLLNEPQAEDFFLALTEVSGAPSVYGLIGLRLLDEKGDVYSGAFKKVFDRDGEKMVETLIGDVIGERPLGKILKVSDAAVTKEKLKYGEYAKKLLIKHPLVKLDVVVDNGLLGEAILNPSFGCYSSYLGLDLKSREKLRKIFKDEALVDKKIIEKKMLHTDPIGVLSMVGFDSSAFILEYLTRPE